MKELINRLQREAEEKANSEKIAAEVALQKKQKAQEEEAKKRRQFVVQQTQKVLRGSGILDAFCEIEKELLEGKFEEHDIVYDPSASRATLRWKDGNIINTVSAVVDPESESLQIGEIDLGNNWKDKDKIREVIAKEFLKPERYDPDYRSGWEGWSLN